MIEVTDEMVDAAALAFTEKPTEATYVVARRMLSAAIKLHEQSKPKPEPVAYRFPYTHSVDVDGEIIYQYSHRKDDFGKWHKAEPLYTTPPTQEPLTPEEIGKILFLCRKGTMFPYSFARDIEKAHGIT